MTGPATARTDEPTGELAGKEASPPAPTFVLQDLRDLRLRRERAVRAAAEAEAAEARATTALESFIRETALGGHPRRSAGTPAMETEHRQAEVDEAKRETEMARRILGTIDAELERFAQPDRVAAVKRQKVKFADLVEEYFVSCDEGEAVVRALAQHLARMQELRARMPGTLGHHPGQAANAADDRRRMAERIEFLLRPYVDGATFARMADLRSREMPGWREHERRQVVDRFDLEHLE